MLKHTYETFYVFYLRVHVCHTVTAYNMYVIISNYFSGTAFNTTICLYGQHPFGDSNMQRTLQNIIAGDAAKLKAATGKLISLKCITSQSCLLLTLVIYLINLVADESDNFNIIAEMIMKKEGDRLALADIKNRTDVDICQHLQTFAEGEKERKKNIRIKEGQVAGPPEETTRPADHQE